jgi:hypothetical protein
MFPLPARYRRSRGVGVKQARDDNAVNIGTADIGNTPS